MVEVNDVEGTDDDDTDDDDVDDDDSPSIDPISVDAGESISLDAGELLGDHSEGSGNHTWMIEGPDGDVRTLEGGDTI